jgi:hypothetical protein
MKGEVFTRHFHRKSLAKIFLEKAKVCPERPDLSQKHVHERGLVLEVIVGSGRCVNSIRWELHRDLHSVGKAVLSPFCNKKF